MEDDDVLPETEAPPKVFSDDDVLEEDRPAPVMGEFEDGLETEAAAAAPVPAKPEPDKGRPRKLRIIRRPEPQPETKQRKRGSTRTEAQVTVIEQATRKVKVEDFIREAPFTPEQMLTTALTMRRGVDVPYGAVFGPRPKLDTQTIGHVPRTDTFLVNHINHVIRLLCMRSKKVQGPPPQREVPRLITGHDMQCHYLVAAVARPSPLNPAVILDPRPCAMGHQCAAMRHYEPMLLNYTKPSFPLIGALDEEEMRQFYRTGRWPHGREPMCVVCHIMITQRSAIVINNLCPSARPPNVQYQSVRSDDDAAEGFKRVALDEPGTDSSVVEYPMMRLCAPGAAIGRWRTAVGPRVFEVPFIDISPSLNRPVGFTNSERWSSDPKN